MSRHPKKRGHSAFSFLILILLICVALGLAVFRPKPDTARTLAEMLPRFAPQADLSLTGLDREIAESAVRCFSLSVADPPLPHAGRAEGSVRLTLLDGARLTDGLAAQMQAMLEEKAAASRRRAELYTDAGELLPALGEALYTAAMEERLSHAGDYCRQETLPVTLLWTRDGWTLQEEETLRALCSTPLPPHPGYTEALAALEPVTPCYALPLTGPGPVPDSACYGESTDMQAVAALLESDTAQRLMGGQTPDFDPARDMLGRPVTYYLDETILAIVWQQDEHGAVGTFAEVFIADASQLRRKIADDTFGTLQYYYPHEFAAQTNAVVACSGDFYNSGRPDFGLYVYEGQLMRSCLSAGQSCLFDDRGDMLFVYENTFADEAEAQRFIDEHRVRFSLSFGPVLVDRGVDVTPYDYPLGEVRDTYARCAIGQLGERHYLAMTINCESPDHYVYVTLRQAADSMIAHGCFNAYTLDGGQTGSILIGGRLINPVQFGEERLMSDIFYFSTALSES